MQQVTITRLVYVYKTAYLALEVSGTNAEVYAYSYRLIPGEINISAEETLDMNKMM